MNIGQKIYYEKETGNIIWVTSSRSGFAVETTKEQDFISYKALSERDPETVDMIQLEYGAYDDDY